MKKLKQCTKNFTQELIRKKVLFLMIAPTIIFFIIFAYVPMP